jgi:hypothetical protein
VSFDLLFFSPFQKAIWILFFNIFTFHLLICEGHSNNNFCFIPGFVPELYFFLVDAMHFPFCNLVNSSSSSCPWSSTIITNYPMGMDNWGVQNGYFRIGFGVDEPRCAHTLPNSRSN